MNHQDISSLLESVQRHTSAWFASLDDRPVGATASAEELRRMLGGPLPREGIAPDVLTPILANAGMSGAVASAGPRYFGFVIGGSLPAALAADWLVSAWDQNGVVYASSPLVSVIEQITGSWLRELAGLPPTMSYGFVTGCQMANFTGLAAARHRVLRNAGWDVESDGLFGAPPIDVVVNEEAHYTVSTALRLLGLGANRVRRIPTDSQGRMRADNLAAALRAHQGTLHHLRASRQREHGRNRSSSRNRRIGKGVRGMVARGWRVRFLGRCLTRTRASRSRHRERRFGGHRCAQVAQRSLRLRDCLLCRRSCAPQRHVPGRRLYCHDGRPAGSSRLCAGRVAARQGDSRICGCAISWTPGNRRNDRTQLPPGKPVFRSLAGRRIRSAQRSGAQPGSGFLRHSGTNSAHHRGDPAGGRLLVRRNRVERPDCDAHQREQLVNDRRGCGEEHRGDRASRAEARPINRDHDQ